MKGGTGKRILQELSQLYCSNKNIFKAAIEDIYGPENQYISNKKKYMRKPVIIPNSPFWFENNLSLPQRVIIVFKLLDKLKYSNDEIVENLRTLTQDSMP